MSFWENKDWLEKTKENSPELVESLKNSKNVEMEWETLSLIIDGVKHELKIGDNNSIPGDQEITITQKDGKKTTYNR